MSKIYSLALLCTTLAATTAAKADYVVNVTPADGSSVSYLSSIIYTCEDASVKLSVDMFQTANPYFTDANGKKYELKEHNAAGLSQNQMRFLLNTPILEAGQYTLTVQEGLISSGGGMFGGGTPMPGLTATYTVTGEGLNSVTYTPAAGEQVEVLTALSFTFDGEETVALASLAATYPVLYKDNAYSPAQLLDANDITIDGNKVSVKLRAQADLGDYKVYFPEGSFLLGADKRSSTPLVYAFEVVPASALYNIEPEANTTVAKIDTIKVSFPGVTKVSVAKENATLNWLCDLGETPGEGNGSWKSNFYDYKVSEDGVVSFSLTSPTMGSYYFNKIFKAPGYYALVIPAGCFLLGDEQKPSPAMKAVYKFDPNHVEEAWTVVTTPADGTVAEAFDEFIVNFEGATTAEFVEGAGLQICKGSEHKGSDWFCNITNVIKVEGQAAAFSIKISSPTMGSYYANKLKNNPGDYNLYIPAGSFLIGADKVASDEIVINFTIGTPAPEEPIVSLQNVRVVKGGQAYSIDGRKLNADAKGLVIKNGAKTIIK